MHILSASSMLALCSIVLAKNHQFCACQSATDGSINIDATAQVRSLHSTEYLWGQAEGDYWVAHDKGPGPRFAGAFLEAAYGWIDGRAFYNLCRNFGGGDSTCFDCSKWHNVNTAIYCDVS
ncbi:hypothetical protein CPAR01_15927 [Colletotrichum paranaense]|uniref:Secreted in xylem 5 n=3 Tax=Colletotrichum acutatum species complex TaxID=2707335 RepID=A0AAI9Z897_9PEZI|nr:uncharacterized protein CCOS01_01902 [Colletotrichum costaricense]XP_060340989.1 uncharacterized protein CPAR01_15927 [Colletotrichum paranaense]KAI3530776.1 hypothetical protein CSPX01_14605 [Colletotrichum filicis]KAK1467121.1 hypothetical protein CMEL01_11114 [Colletotrichum melonis]KAK1517447.1 hypothetical protein CPAR01_15927 [Colletotrichum paranaense]KAK1536582.1 hypothetical protein CCOS01_01902 [Colletotrichum costaricense]